MYNIQICKIPPEISHSHALYEGAGTDIIGEADCETMYKNINFVKHLQSKVIVMP